MQDPEGLRGQEALGVLNGERGRRLNGAFALASSRLRLSKAFEKTLGWSWANAGFWAAVALFSPALAPWAVLGCGACVALSCAAFFALGRVDRFQAARAVDRASQLNELVSTALECAEGTLRSRFSPLVVAEAERALEEGRWRLPRPGLPARARYAAVPGALLVLFALLPAGSEGRGGSEGEPTAEDVLAPGGEGESRFRSGLKRPRRVAMASGARRRRAAMRNGAGRASRGVPRASAGRGEKGTSGAGKRPGRPARAFGRAEPPEPGVPLPYEGGWTEQEKAEFASLVEAYPRYAGVIGRYFGEGER